MIRPMNTNEQYQTAPAQALLTAAEASVTLRVSAQTVHRYAKDGLLTPIRLGYRTVRYRRADVERLVAEGIPVNNERRATTPCARTNGGHAPHDAS